MRISAEAVRSAIVTLCAPRKIRRRHRQWSIRQSLTLAFSGGPSETAAAMNCWTGPSFNRECRCRNQSKDSSKREWR